ncbi:hypothetical protein O6235_23570, partial [Salmonella enterica subsp. enterica]
MSFQRLIGYWRRSFDLDRCGRHGDALEWHSTSLRPRLTAIRQQCPRLHHAGAGTPAGIWPVAVQAQRGTLMSMFNKVVKQFQWGQH